MPCCYPPEFRRRVFGLIAVGRSAASIAADFGVSNQTIDVRRKPELIDTGSTQGLTTDEAAELVGAGCNILMIPLAAGVLMPWGFDMPPATGAALMSLSTIIVAVNAQLLRRLKLDVDRD